MGVWDPGFALTRIAKEIGLKGGIRAWARIFVIIVQNLQGTPKQRKAHILQPKLLEPVSAT
ncbi:MAG: hypothetical protein DMG87_16915 [Acidobacteria bacterium]|nr:MAG: hypothetical protein DMG87_16915 [Acidobacteriota bacterium]